MRYDAEHRGKTREKILKEAAAAIRAEGPHRMGVAALMKRAGLTHGGFYAHFGSKEALVQEATGLMFGEARARLARSAQDKPPAVALADYIDFYLSHGHRDARDRGCPIPTLSSDMARLEPQARERFSEGIGQLRDRLASLLTALARPDPEALACSVMAELVGALALSRAVADPEESNRILAASRSALKTRLEIAA